jgi:nucleoside-diphosphate-sugar epimerase
MRIFMTGATGVVGRRAVPTLTAAGYQVTAAGRNPVRLAALERAGAATITLELFDRAAVQRAVAGHDAVVNLATHMPPSAIRMTLPGAFRENDRVRREGSAILAEVARAGGVSRFIQESFAPIYMDGGDAWLDESAPVRPARYNRTVLDAERHALAFGQGGTTGVVLRFAAFYGPDAPHLHDMLTFVRKGWAPLPGAASAYWSSISHDDAASAVVAALTLPSGIYNVCDDEPLTRRAYVDALADAFGLPRPRLFPAWTTRLMGSFGELMGRSERMSNHKLRATGWVPRYPSAREGLRATATEMAVSSQDDTTPRSSANRSRHVSQQKT